METRIAFSVRMSIERTIELLAERRDHIRAWLDQEAPYARADQFHLDRHTPEQAYWHYGYMMALADVIARIEDDVAGGDVDRPAHDPRKSDT